LLERQGTKDQFPTRWWHGS